VLKNFLYICDHCGSLYPTDIQLNVTISIINILNTTTTTTTIIIIIIFTSVIRIPIGIREIDK